MITLGNTSLPADADPPCAGLWALFDSTKAADHQQARRICGGCDYRLRCVTSARAERDRHDGGPVGTWGGVLYGRDKRRGVAA